MIIGIQPISQTMLEFLDQNKRKKDDITMKKTENVSDGSFDILFQAELEKLRNNG